MTEPLDETKGPDEEPFAEPPVAEEPAPEAPAPEPPAPPTLEEQLAERTADLQRLQAEYVNYKRRVDRDREVVRAAGAESVLRSLMTVLDDIRRADAHGQLEGGFKAVADSLQQTVKAQHLESFGEPGEPFDPNLHEAVFHAGTSPDVVVQSVDAVMQVGYRVGDRILRPATVSVVDPAGDDDEPDDGTISED
ncbi:MAG: grpE [Nocardioidaceae bacterium]|nr:grpE [Nocardioidaceae bacterium]